MTLDLPPSNRPDITHPSSKRLADAIEITRLEQCTVALAAEISQQATALNASSRCYSEREILEWMDRPDHWALRVSFRGLSGALDLVGLMLCQADEEDFIANGFLLADRAIGHGIELAMVRSLGTLALENGCGAVVLPIKKTTENSAAYWLYERLGSGIEILPSGEMEVAFAAIATDEILQKAAHCLTNTTSAIAVAGIEATPQIPVVPQASTSFLAQ